VIDNGRATVIDKEIKKRFSPPSREGACTLYNTDQENVEGSHYEEPKEERGKAARASLKVWHQRLGHCHKEAIMKIPALDVKRNQDGEDNFCEIFIQGKSKKLKFPKMSENSTTGTLELLHSDVAGPFKLEGLTVRGWRTFCYVGYFCMQTWRLSRRQQAAWRCCPFVTQVSQGIEVIFIRKSVAEPRRNR